MTGVEVASEIGKLLFHSGLIDGASGNMSFREGDAMFITRSGVCLDDLTEKSFIKLDISKDEYVKEASVDQGIHREIYRKTDYSAVVHCHGVFNVVLSLKYDVIEPIDLEGRLYFGKIEVVSEPFGSPELAKSVAEAVKNSGVAVVRGHGIYSAGESLRDAFNKAAYVEHSSEVKYRLLSLEKLNLD